MGFSSFKSYRWERKKIVFRIKNFPKNILFHFLLSSFYRPCLPQRSIYSFSMSSFLFLIVLSSKSDKHLVLLPIFVSNALSKTCSTYKLISYFFLSSIKSSNFLLFSRSSQYPIGFISVVMLSIFKNCPV